MVAALSPFERLQHIKMHEKEAEAKKAGRYCFSFRQKRDLIRSFTNMYTCIFRNTWYLIIVLWNAETERKIVWVRNLSKEIIVDVDRNIET